jgi:molybdate transport system ATP-binding protein
VTSPALEARFVIEVGDRSARFRLDAEFALAQGVLVFFGPTGAGKSLAIQALAGLIRPREGRIAVAGETLFDAARRLFVPAHRRRVGYVPQHHALFPFLDVERNVAFGLPRRERRRGSPRVQAILEDLGIASLARARPASLSGGERQKVALARALVVRPRLLLLDEPFASVDADGRSDLREVLRSALERHGTPAVLVTHDPEDALAMGDTLVRFSRGRTTHTGAPGELLRRGHPVRVRGRLAGPAEAADPLRALARLLDAEVEGPAALLGGQRGDVVDLELRTRPRGGLHDAPGT